MKFKMIHTYDKYTCEKKLWMICDGVEMIVALYCFHTYMRKRRVSYCGGGVRLSKLIFDEVLSSLVSIYHKFGVNESNQLNIKTWICSKILVRFLCENL